MGHTRASTRPRSRSRRSSTASFRPSAGEFSRPVDRSPPARLTSRVPAAEAFTSRQFRWPHFKPAKEHEYMSPVDPKNDGGQKAEEGADNGEFARLLAESERSLKEGELIRGRVLQVTNDE